MLNRRDFAAAALSSLAVSGGQRDARRTPRRNSGDALLPWEGGAGYYRRWTNGPPANPGFFPVSVWLQEPRHAARYKAIGVNQYIGLRRGPADSQLELLSAAGMPVLAAQNQAALESRHGAIIRSWTMVDEPDNARALPGGGYGSCILPPEIAGASRRLREKDATRPVFLNLGQAVINPQYKGRGSFCSRHEEHYPEYIKAVDIVSFDVYPVNNNLPLWYAGAGVRRLREWANYKKPVWNWIETASIRGGPKPTPDDIKSEVWMSIVNGSMGIGYFCHQFKPAETDSAPLQDKETSAALAAINARITALAPVLNEPSVADGVAVESRNPELPIEWMLKRHGDRTYLFAIGARPGVTSEVEFTLRDCGNLRAEVLDESRTVRVSGGVFRDTFSGYQPHLYELPFRPGAGSL